MQGREEAGLLPVCPPQGPSTDLPVLVQDIAKQPVGVREALGASTLPHAHNTVLLRVKHTALGGEAWWGRAQTCHCGQGGGYTMEKSAFGLSR